MPLGEGSERRLWRAASVCLVLGLSCASTPWPDEPGVPVALGRAANVEAGDSFLSALTATRGTRGLPAPLVTPRYQSDIRTFAEDLQSGKTSAAGAQRAVEAWGNAAFHRRVESWVVDCGPGQTPRIPQSLAERPAVAVTYAAAHFRPRSLGQEQCAVLVVALTGNAEAVHFDGALK
jgi:hypothetical protein